jgi:hypothetical protein
MKNYLFILFYLLFYSLGFTTLLAQTPTPTYTSSKFEQLGEELPTPNMYRSGSGEPGPEYWQQQADYKIKVELEDATQSIKGSETITYTNNSPNDILFLWIQLDQNRFDNESEEVNTLNFSLESPYSWYLLNGMLSGLASEGGYTISNVKDAQGKELKHVINKTMMRIDLPTPLKAKGGKVTFSMDWNYKVVDGAGGLGSRSGYEYFAKDDNYVYEISQWYPRMAVYDDVNGWQNKQFLGRGEFALTFGNYEVEITVPSDHIVAATGELQNAAKVLNATHLARLEEAKKAKEPVKIVTQAEATKSEKEKKTDKKTWIYKANDVRDFAWASSRKFIWDAQQTEVEGKKIMAMSYYPKEGNPLWERVSTKSIVHTLKVYSKHTIAYPYPVAISVHGPVGGMEYPMISFNNQGRPDEDGKYEKDIEFQTISVIIHEVGHNFFPMIVNSDERQWTWMDEGLNTFCQYLAEREWDKDFPFYAGPPASIVPYMKGDQKALVPIMTNSDNISIFQFGPNAYGKPATALNILRETVMGPELFDFAFKEYARRWAFRHPMPADFFRTMENASATDLDWFWRGWFYGTEPVDVSLEKVTLYKMPQQKLTVSAENPFETADYNPGMYNYMKGQMGRDADKIITNTQDKYFYNLDFKNVGGLLSPLLIQVNYKDGTNEMKYISAEIWRLDPNDAHKILLTTKEVASFVLDPEAQTADIDTDNNAMPRKAGKTKFDEMKEKGDGE